MHKDETKCFLCGSEVAPDPTKVTYKQRFASAVKFALIISCAMTVASLFHRLRAFLRQVHGDTVVLGLVKNSAQQMKENA